MQKISNKIFDQERSLYASKDVKISNCKFAGPNDGESVLKESKNIVVEECVFSLRYPLWHDVDFKIINTKMDELTRAPIWYAKNGEIIHSTICGVKAIRECENISIKDSKIVSTEFGWRSKELSLNNTSIEGEYLFFESSKVTLNNVKLKGKYSLQYVNDLTINDSNFDTKDAFWHSKNVVVKNSVIKGEYLAWFSENLTLINCKIIGTQPFCYCRNLKLIDCEMVDCDLAFEYSDVEATIKGKVDSIKNPLSGTITVDEVGEIINENPVYECTGKVIIR